MKKLKLNDFKKKEVLILTAALIIPGGLIALGLWKAYDLYKKKPTKEEEQKP